MAVALSRCGRCRRRLTVFELLVLAVTLVGAVQAVRGVIWFALAAAAILPVALDGVLTRADVDAPRVNRVISLVALAGLAVALVASLARPASWFSRNGPSGGSRRSARRRATRRTRLWATDGTADWLLWRIPDLRGRLAFDVRFELYDAGGARRASSRTATASGGLASGSWTATTSSSWTSGATWTRSRREPGARVVYRDHDIAVVRGSF